MMINNYFLTALRGLRKRPVFSLITIGGLSLGICAFLVILDYIDFETRYDDFHRHGASIYRVTRTTVQGEERSVPRLWTTHGLGPALKEDLPEVRRYIRTHGERGVMTYHSGSGQVKTFREQKLLAADSAFFRAFTFAAVSGSLATSLDEPNAVVLTRAVAEKYFGYTNVVGETMQLTGSDMDGTYTVSAVMEDVPGNSHFTFDVVFPIHNMLQGRYKQDDGWGSNNFHTYVQLEQTSSPEAAGQKLPGVCARRIDPKWKNHNIRMELNLQPLREAHLDPSVGGGEADTTSYGTLYFFGLIAFAILCIAWINYINLSTARAIERARDVGVRKAVGASRMELVVQFLAESFVINGIGIVLAMTLAVALLPLLGDVTGKHLSFDYTDVRLWLVLSALWLLGTFASGIYPAFVLSSASMARVSKAGIKGGGYPLRKVLVVSQFCASLVLITGTFVVYNQIRHMQNRDKGLNIDQTLVVAGPATISWDDAKRKVALLKTELRKVAGVKAVATSAAVPGGGHNWGADVRRNGTALSDIKPGEIVWVDHNFIPVYGATLISGRNFNQALASDRDAVIINETAVKAYELGNAQQALEQQLILEKDTAQIIGVLKDYNWNSLKTDYTAFILKLDTLVPMNISVQLSGTQLSSTVEAIGEVYKELVPDEPFDYYFLDEAFNAQYKSDVRFGRIFGLFAGLAIVISCLGLWGLASFATAQRLKEIGIRKALGATVRSIVYLLASQFMKLVLVAAVLGLPLSWYLMNAWLSGFAFRITMQWYLFIIPIAVLMLLALGTVSLKVLKGAMTNPARVLKSE